MNSETKSSIFLALADFLIPSHKQMPKFSTVCSFSDAMTALDFRIDLKDGFARAIPHALPDGEETFLELLNRDDSEAFTALSTVVIATYYMNPTVRAHIGYPGQENVTYDNRETQFYLTDGSLGKVIGRGRKYRPTPGL